MPAPAAPGPARSASPLLTIRRPIDYCRVATALCPGAPRRQRA